MTRGFSFTLLLVPKLQLGNARFCEALLRGC
jgi:hypothetical protein